MKRLDLVLVNPGDRNAIYQSLGSQLAAVEPPVWAGMIAEFIRNRGNSVSVVDAAAEELTPEETAESIASIGPFLTAVIVYGHQPSASTQNMPAAGAVCKALKERAPNLKVLLVGGHVAALPERTLREEAADFVSGGEGPYTILELLYVLKSTSAQSDDYSKVRGLYYWDGEIMKSNPPAPLIKDLDRELPGIAWDLLPMERYRAHNWHCFGDLRRQPYAALYTTLGCPYHCSFCCIQAPFKNGEKMLGYMETVNSYRSWSPQSVIAQIDKLVNEHGVRNIKIEDEMFVLNYKHVGAICDSIIKRGYNLNMWAYARVDTVKPQILGKLKRAGFNWLALGIESESDYVRDGVDKNFGKHEIKAVVRAIRDAGINVIGNYIFGLPDDTMETMQATLDMALDLNCEFANFYSAMAYPGSQLYHMAVREGWTLPETWSGYSQHSVNTLPLPTKYLSAAEVLRFRDHAFQVYFNSPRYLLDMVTCKFGPDTASHVREMASHKLERKYA